MGIMTPKDFDIELASDSVEEEPAPVPSTENTNDKQAGLSGQGRPVGIKDSEKRKKKEIRPRTAAKLVEAMSWAESSQKIISEYVNAAYLSSLKKKSLRELSSQEFESLEKTKFHILCQLKPIQVLDKKLVGEIISSKMEIPARIKTILSIATKNYIDKEGVQPNTETRRKIEASSVAIFRVDEMPNETCDTDNIT